MKLLTKSRVFKTDFDWYAIASATLIQPRRKPMSARVKGFRALSRKIHVLGFVLLVFFIYGSATNLKAQNVVSGHYTPSDRYQHVMAVVDGTMHEIFFDPARGIFQTPIAHFENVVSISSFVS